MKATRAPATSLSALVKSSIAKPAATNSTLTYALSAVAALALHVGISYVSGNGAQGLTIFVKSKFVFRWVRESTTRRFNIGDIVQSIVIAALLATLALSLTASVFGIIRSTLPLVYKLPLLRIILRPFTAHFLRGPWTIFLPLRHVSLLIKSWFLGFTTLATWEFSNEIFDTFPLSVIGAIPEPHVILVSGVSSTDLGFRYLAYKDIHRFSSADSESAANLRSSLFNDQKYNPNLWNHLVRESLLFLGKDYQHFLHRGKPASAPPKPATPAAPVTPSRPSVVTTQAPLIRTSIFKSSNQASPMRNVMESLGSDGALVQALDAGTAATHIPALFKSVGATVLPAPKEEVKKRVEKAESSVGRYVKQAKEEFLKVVVTNMPVWVNELGTQFDTWWNKERLEKIAQSYLPNAEVDVVIVDEDRFGVVQRDIPKILEAMLSFLSAIQAYHFEVRSQYVPPIQDQVYTPEQIAEAEAIRVEVEKACDVLDHLSEYLRAGIARIVRTFGDKLLAFKFPPRIAEKLQPFIEYC
ncbi:hypothetical protein C0989_007373 [Termitomyces sp. Mn162]|nr:hypothetical protein C0989_007373 [Termitomyces sp. Mn162]